MARKKQNWLKKRSYLEPELVSEDSGKRNFGGFVIDNLLKSGCISKKQHYAGIWFLIRTLKARKEYGINNRSTNTDVICAILKDGYLLKNGFEMEYSDPYRKVWLRVCKNLVKFHPNLYKLLLNVIVDNHQISLHMIKVLRDGLDVVYKEGVNFGAEGSERSIETKSSTR